MTKECKHCQIEFNLHSRRKKQVGGYINECPDCVEELSGDNSEPMHFGVSGVCGSVSVRRFKSEADRSKFEKDYQSTKTIKDFL